MKVSLRLRKDSKRAGRKNQSSNGIGLEKANSLRKAGRRKKLKKSRILGYKKGG